MNPPDLLPVLPTLPYNSKINPPPWPNPGTITSFLSAFCLIPIPRHYCSWDRKKMMKMMKMMNSIIDNHPRIYLELSV
jgi:hypothetical protein